MSGARPLDAFPPVRCGEVRVWVDRERPLAVLQRDGQPDRVVAWPDLPTGWAAPAVWRCASPDGVWVHYGIADGGGGDGPLDRWLADVDAPAVHVDAATGAVGVVRVGRERVLGATRHGLWTTSATHPQPDPDAPYLGGPMPDDWAEETRCTVHAPDGRATAVVVDRHVMAVEEQADQLRLLVQASPPVAVQSAGPFPSTSYDYRPTELTLPAADPLPGRIRFRSLVPDGWGDPWDFARPSGRPVPDWLVRHPVPDPPSSDVDWTVVDLPEELQRLAVDELLAMLGDLEHYWHHEDGRRTPLSPGLSEPRVEVVGEHPRTRLEVSFRHPDLADGRVRRVLPVYDAAGRVVVNPYADIHLMEDLDTGAIGRAGAPVAGVLDI